VKVEIWPHARNPGATNVRRKTHRRPYWRETKRLAVFTLLAIGVAVVLALFAPQLDGRTLLGLPLGYFLGLYGGVGICLVGVARFASRQDEIDQWHGAQEDL
jgi:putative solute:sodium symporter small subunit